MEEPAVGESVPLVLIVDDTPLARKTFRAILEGAGYRTIEAGSTREAIQTYRDAHPDVVTMDMLMEEHDGIVATQALLRLDPQARIVICSATADPSFVAAAAKLGVVAYLNKPIPAERLIAAIEKALGRNAQAHGPRE